MLPWAPLMHSADGVESPNVSCDQLLSFTGVQGYRPQLHTVSSMKMVQLPSHPHGIVRKQKYDAAVQTSCKLPSAACTYGWKTEVSVRFGGLSKQRIPSVAARWARPWQERGIWQSGAAVVRVSSEVFRTTPLLLCMAARLGVYLGSKYSGSSAHSLSVPQAAGLVLGHVWLTGVVCRLLGPSFCSLWCCPGVRCRSCHGCPGHQSQPECPSPSPPLVFLSDFGFLTLS